MTEKNKDMHEYLKIKLDTIVKIFLMLIAVCSGEIGYTVAKFSENSILFNTVCIAVAVVFSLGILFLSAGIVIILKKLRSLI